MKVSKKILAILAAFGFVINVGAAEAAVISSVTENSPIVLKQNNPTQIQIAGESSDQLQQLYHYSHSSHSSHYSHRSHQSHYSSYY